eukprot:CAMPEP_0201594038 /NCGR_PEP_ID=MMETSP0190_2-20130828/191479_1 /ASSEMBLY_ACC=CAM_ASM_000263 /TAXON_ID=37353 /ORGANISM="Rosalina sp." /LENGTH=476 /DNA_ID=CAMNT_0048053495 /DNA_START=362 /DNA_END=1792 /DNA_ORIENTATION=+
MAKDAICLDDKECYKPQSQSDAGNYLVFGYNIQDEESSHVFSMEKQNDDIIMGGVLSLNRETTSFIQQFYNRNPNMEKQFAHYLHRQNGYLAIGDDIDQLLNVLSIGKNDLTWIRYYNHDPTAMYQVQLEKIELINTFENETIFENDTTEYLDILTFDTAISGIAMNEIWQDDVLTFIINVSDVALIENTYYPYCIDTGHDNIIDDLYNKLPDIRYYPYCIDTGHDNIIDDLYNKLPDIRISLPSKIGKAGYEFIISPQQYVVQIHDEIANQFCLDISFDWDEGICLGSLAMNNYIVIYNEDAEAIAVYDKNLNHQRQQNSNNQNNDDLFDVAAQENPYVYALSMALVVLLFCFLFLSLICACLLRRKDSGKYERLNAWHIRGRSVTVDPASSPVRIKGPVSPEHVAVDVKKQESLELDSRSSSDNKGKGKDRREVNVSMDSSITPFGSYYDGNVKAIVYDRVIEPWMEDDNIDAI